MNALNLISSLLMIIGCFILLKLSFNEFSDGIFKGLIYKNASLKDDIKINTGRKKDRFFRREITEVRAILKVTGRENMMSLIMMLSVLLMVTGITVALLLNNTFLIPVFAVGFMLLPIWYVKLTKGHYKRATSDELETALSIITTSYLRTDNICLSIKENIDYLNEPIKSVFKGFDITVSSINSDIESAIISLKSKIENPIFKEWCDGILACQHDRSLKTTLIPTISKLSDMRVVNSELENLIMEPRKEYISMVILVIGNIPLMYFLNKDWYSNLMHTVIGQITLAICFLMIFISFAYIVKLSDPVEFRR